MVRVFRAIALVVALNLASVHAFSTAPCFLGRPGGALPLRSLRKGARAASPTCLLSVADQVVPAVAGAAKFTSFPGAAKAGADAVVAGASSPPVQAAKVKSLDAAAWATKTVTSPPEDSNFLSAIFGSDSLLVTILATTVRPQHFPRGADSETADPGA